jgi:hypothetical protein
VNRIPATGDRQGDYTVEVSSGCLNIWSPDDTRPGRERRHFSLKLSREGMYRLAMDALADVIGVAIPWGQQTVKTS